MLKNLQKKFLEVPLDSRNKVFFPDDKEKTNSEDEPLLPPLLLSKSRRPSQSAVASLLPSPTSSLPLGVMRKVMRVVVAGSKKAGKTAILQQLACYRDITSQVI